MRSHEGFFIKKENLIFATRIIFISATLTIILFSSRNSQIVNLNKYNIFQSVIHEMYRNGYFAVSEFGYYTDLYNIPSE